MANAVRLRGQAAGEVTPPRIGHRKPTCLRGDGVPRSLPIEWVVTDCAAALGDRFHYAARAVSESLAGIDRGIAFVFHNSGTPRISLRRLVALVRAEDPNERMSFTLFPIAGSTGLLSRPEFASVYRELGLVLWV